MCFLGNKKMTEVAMRHTERVNYPDLDLMKLAMAFLVVEIHTRPLTGFPFAERIVEGIDVVAVPFFFVASALLCFRGLDEGSFADGSLPGAVRVRKTTGKLLRLYFVWTAIYLPVTVFGGIIRGDGFVHAVLFFIRGTLFVGENYYSWPLWYLLASVIGFTLVYLCLRGGVRSKRILLASSVLLLAGYCITFVQGWDGAPAVLSIPVKAYGLVFGGSRNGLFEGFFYVAMGAVLGMNCSRVVEVPVLAELALVVAGLAGTVFVSNDAHLPFCMAASIGLFLLSARRCGSDLKPHVGARNASTVIYLVHMYFAVLFVYGICGGTDADLYSNGVNAMLLYLFALGSSAAASVLVIAASKELPILKKIFGI